MSEIWKPVVGYETLYEISSAGRIRSLPVPGDQRGQPRGKILSPSPNRGGWLVFSASAPDRRQRTLLLHSVVALAFIGPRPKGAKLRHRNGDRADCRVSNLVYRRSLGQRPQYARSRQLVAD